MDVIIIKTQLICSRLKSFNSEEEKGEFHSTIYS